MPICLATTTLIVLALALWLWSVHGYQVSKAPTKEPTRVMACQGYASLCDRRLNTLALAATHNSMAAARAPRWLPLAGLSQGGSISAQLDFGIRGFLLDVFYGVPVNGTVYTDLRHAPAFNALLGKTSRDPRSWFVRRARADTLDASRTRSLYLCHVYCELGATPFIPVLTTIRTWLQVHPHDVLVIILGDYAVPAAIAHAFEASGLSSYVYTHPPGTPWPTLEQMITANRRIVVSSYHYRGSQPAWNPPTYSVFQETPYSITTPATFSCAGQRGSPKNPLFLLNHWIARTRPSPRDAARVNAYHFLLRRAQQCGRARHHTPNLIAVNFYDHGQVLNVINELNEVT